jgi:hypothetical protein
MFHSKELGGRRQAQEPTIFRRIIQKSNQELKEIFDFYENRNNYTSTIKPIFADSLSELNNKTIEERRKQLNPTYDQVIAAGFKREIASDDVFENQHGYPYFLVNYEAENLIIEWDVLSHELTLTVAHQLIGRITFDKAKAIIEELDRPKQD